MFDATPRPRNLGRFLRIVAAVSLVWGTWNAAPTAAQEFEEISPAEIQEIPTQGQQGGKQGGGATYQFEEIKPEFEEIRPGAAPQAAPARDDEPLRSQMGAKPQPAAAPEARPVVAPPASPQPDDDARRAADMRSSVPLPSSGVSLDSDFQQEIRGLNQQIQVLKERVIEAKSRLLSYSQKVAQGFASGTQLFMKVDNNLGRDFKIERLVFYLDGHQVFTREFEMSEDVDEILAYKGSVLPGRHRIDVDAILHGDDGMFDFGYSARLRLESGEYFAANEGKIVELNLVLHDRGGAFKAIESRPALKFEILERDVF